MQALDLVRIREELLQRMPYLVHREQRATREVVRALSRLDAESAHTWAGYSSLFAYCTIALGYSEPAAMRRIKAARCIRRFPQVDRLLLGRKLNLTTICLLSDVLTVKNAQELLNKAAGRSKREVEELVAPYRPEPEYKTYDSVRPIFFKKAVAMPERLPFPYGGSREEINRWLENYRRQEKVTTVQEQKIRVSFVADPELKKQLRRMQQLLSGKYPRGVRLEDVFREAMDCYIQRNCPVERARRKLMRKVSANPRESRGRLERDPGKHSRHIPSRVKMEVYLRDGFQCTYVAPDGRRCESRSQIEVDHINPYAKGGGNDPENLRLLCKAHNCLEAENHFGREHMERFRKVG